LSQYLGLINAHGVESNDDLKEFESEKVSALHDAHSRLENFFKEFKVGFGFYSGLLWEKVEAHKGNSNEFLVNIHLVIPYLFAERGTKDVETNLSLLADHFGDL